MAVKPSDEIAAQRQLLILGWFADLHESGAASVPLREGRADEEWLKEVAERARKRIDEEWQRRFGGSISRTPEAQDNTQEATG